MFVPIIDIMSNQWIKNNKNPVHIVTKEISVLWCGIDKEHGEWKGVLGTGELKCNKPAWGGGW